MWWSAAVGRRWVDGGRFRSCEEQREQLRGRICGRGS